MFWCLLFVHILQLLLLPLPLTISIICLSTASNYQRIIFFHAITFIRLVEDTQKRWQSTSSDYFVFLLLLLSLLYPFTLSLLTLSAFHHCFICLVLPLFFFFFFFAFFMLWYFVLYLTFFL